MGFRNRAVPVLAFALLSGALQAEPLPGTQPLTATSDLAADMIAGISRYLDEELKRASYQRQERWKRDYSSLGAYRRSIEENRRRLAKIIGLIDERADDPQLTINAVFGSPSPAAKTSSYEVHAVRWQVLAGLEAEGLLIEPVKPPAVTVIAIPDADWSPEQLAGIAPGIPREAQYARRLAEQGARVLVPVLINREDTWSGNARFRLTNQPHREFIHRMTYQMGRHIVGLEAQKVMAAVDWAKQTAPRLPVGIAGYGEGGLIAIHAAASDPRIEAVVISGYFQSREQVWQEPIYRNIWSVLAEFGDADMASLIAPRTLVIEAVEGPQVAGPRPPTAERRGAAPGTLAGPPARDVRREFERAREFYQKLGAGEKVMLVSPEEGAKGTPGSTPALSALLKGLGVSWQEVPATSPEDRRKGYDPNERLKRQFDQMVEFTQTAMRTSSLDRQRFWSKADHRSVEGWERTAEQYREYYWREVIGRLPDPSEPLGAFTREDQSTGKWRRYDVVLPVWPDVFAYGVLLVPRNLRDGERRPVVVCQHGLEGRPSDVILPADERTSRVYGNFAAKLADRGFVVFAPQAPYIGDFRFLQRKANPLKLSIYSFILGQNQRILEWLAAQPYVDPQRIGFYGLSYGGKTALRVPPLLKQYALSICSGDFNEWIWKVTTTDFAGSYMFTHEWEIMEFDTGNTFNHAELAMLMAPRPFMVERGHRDGVVIDEWVAFEYAKVRRFYDELGIGGRTAIEYFNGPHQIHGVGTFDFLHKFLRWPEPRP